MLSFEYLVWMAGWPKSMRPDEIAVQFDMIVANFMKECHRQFDPSTACTTTLILRHSCIHPHRFVLYALQGSVQESPNVRHRFLFV